MPIQKVFSRDATYQKFEVLKTNRNKRHRYGLFFVEGVRNINGAIKNGWHIVSFVYTRQVRFSDWATGLLENVKTNINYELPVELMAALSDKTDTSELLAIVEMRDDDPSLLRFSKNPILALLDRPSNKGNLGTMIRSCDALGVDAVVIAGHAVDLYDPEVIAASTGSFFRVPIIRIAENSAVEAFVQRIKSEYPGFKTIGTTAHAERPISDIDMTGPVMLMIGNEAVGLSQAFKESCDALAVIPMSPESSATSLNISCAASIMFYEVNRQRS